MINKFAVLVGDLRVSERYQVDEINEGISRAGFCCFLGCRESFESRREQRRLSSKFRRNYEDRDF